MFEIRVFRLLFSFERIVHQNIEPADIWFAKGDGSNLPFLNADHLPSCVRKCVEQLVGFCAVGQSFLCRLTCVLFPLLDDFAFHNAICNLRPRLMQKKDHNAGY